MQIEIFPFALIWYVSTLNDIWWDTRMGQPSLNCNERPENK